MNIPTIFRVFVFLLATGTVAFVIGGILAVIYFAATGGFNGG